jgi:hypothetical protein
LIFLTRFGERKNRGSSSIEYPALIETPEAVRIVSEMIFAVCRRAQIIKRILHAPVAHLLVRCESGTAATNRFRQIQ